MFQLSSFYSISFFEVLLLPFSVLPSDLFLLILTFELLLILSDTLLFRLFCLLPLLLLSYLGIGIFIGFVLLLFVCLVDRLLLLFILFIGFIPTLSI